MWKPLILANCLLAVAPISFSAKANNKDISQVYISGTEDGSRAIHLLQRVIQLQRDTAQPTIITLRGRFLIDKPIRIGPDNHNISIYSDKNDKAEFFSVGSTNQSIVVENSSNITIKGLSINNFQKDGILIKNSKNVVIKDNRVFETKSKGWSQASIHLTGSVAGGLVEGNLVQGADYAGIQIDTNSNSDVSNVKVLNNYVVDTCRLVRDCGAIYVNDRGKKSKGLIISGNKVKEFGNSLTEGRGIYLDDWASNVFVSHNYITGPGAFAFQIHGGKGNIIQDNIVDMANIKKFLLYQYIDDRQWTMSNNVLKNNIIQENTSHKELLLSKVSSKGDSVKTVGNLQCSGTICKSIWQK